jgi:microcystin-dependent protein
MSNWSDQTIPDAPIAPTDMVDLTSAADLTVANENANAATLTGTTDTQKTAVNALIVLINTLPDYFIVTNGVDNYMRGDMDMNNHRIQNLADATIATDVVTHGQLKVVSSGADTITSALSGAAPTVILTGGSLAMQNNLDLGTKKIINVVDPIDETDAVTRGWVASAFVLDDNYQSRLYGDIKPRQGNLNMAGLKTGAVDNAQDTNDVVNQQDFTTALNNQNLGGNTEPAGTVRAWAGKGASPPVGYLFCDGTEYAKAEYPSLYTILLDTNSPYYPRFGSTSNSDRFKVPDMRGRFVCGLDDTFASSRANVLDHVTSTSDGAVGYTQIHGPTSDNIFGDEDVVLTVGDTRHTHAFVDGVYVNTTTGTPYSPVGLGNAGSVTGWDNDNVTTPYTTEHTGGSAKHENLPPVMMVRWLICTG